VYRRFDGKFIAVLILGVKVMKLQNTPSSAVREGDDQMVKTPAISLPGVSSWVRW
jgi:hypothetical protein